MSVASLVLPHAALAQDGPPASTREDGATKRELVIHTRGQTDKEGFSAEQLLALRNLGIKGLAIPRALPADHALALVRIVPNSTDSGYCVELQYAKRLENAGVITSFGVAIGNSKVGPCAQTEVAGARRYSYSYPPGWYYRIVVPESLNTFWARSKMFGEVAFYPVGKGCYRASAKDLTGQLANFRDLCLDRMSKIEMRRLIESADTKSP